MLGPFTGFAEYSYSMGAPRIPPSPNVQLYENATVFLIKSLNDKYPNPNETKAGLGGGAFINS